MKSTLLGSLLLAGVCAQAQPVMVSDFNRIDSSSSNPCWLTGYYNKLLFFADNGINGNELCTFNDTAIAVVADLNPISAGGPSSSFRKMAQVKNDIYFPGDNGNTGMELFKWTGSGLPVLVAEVRAGASGSDPDEVVAFSDKLYFNANDGINGNELWTYDPATNSAQRLTDLATGTNSSNPHDFVAYKGKLYFVATGSSTGIELYCYDPATNATTLATDINTGIGSSNPQALTVINDKLYLTASTLTYGRELYMFDGKNIVRLTNIDNGANDGAAAVANGQTGIISYKNMILFSGNSGLSGNQFYQYNPANGVASMVFMMNPLGNSDPSNFKEYAGKLFFSADDGVHGNELWAYDGKLQPYMVGDIDSGMNASSPMDMTQYGTHLYFSASTTASGRELYVLLDSAALSVQNVKFNASVKVYPNPATSETHIAIELQRDQAMAILITDITGKEILNIPVKNYTSGEHIIDVPMQQATPGIYIYRIADNSGKMLAGGKIQKQ
ncbi:MAG: T9SS type A sorting domain-containing protein [Bacteroidetes bacterium]|nr:T9SS type A sorting domain-containing protein [Bacteroidota bacterium]